MDLNLIIIFARTAELRSFSAAAASLQLPKSTVSRSIKRLESELKEPLFLRSTRHVELTPLGQRLFAACFSELVTLGDNLRAALSNTDQPSRLIRITAVEDLGEHLLPEVLARFSKRYPRIRFEILLTNDLLDLIREGVDIAVRVGKLSQSSFRKRHIGYCAFILVASARYGERFPVIALNDLANHPLLVLPGFLRRNKTLHFENGKEQSNIPVAIRATATSTATLLKMVQRDLGIGLLPDFLCREGLSNGSFVRVGQGWYTPSQRVSLLFVAKEQKDPVVKELGEYMYEHFRRHLSPC